MSTRVDQAIVIIVQAIEFVAVGVLVVGLTLSMVAFASDWIRSGLGATFHAFRANLGRSILSGLEILIVADIIRTVAVDPTLANVLVLGLVVLIRTFLSFALEVEISGTLPWRRSGSGPPHEVDGGDRGRGPPGGPAATRSRAPEPPEV